MRSGHTGGKPIKPLTARKAYERERTKREGKKSKTVAVMSAQTAQPEREQPARPPNPVRIISEPEPVRPGPSKPDLTSPPDDLATSLDQGRGWLPKPKKQN